MGTYIHSTNNYKYCTYSIRNTHIRRNNIQRVTLHSRYSRTRNGTIDEMGVQDLLILVRRPTRNL